jgi:hypothetical protein
LLGRTYRKLLVPFHSTFASDLLDRPFKNHRRDMVGPQFRAFRYKHIETLSFGDARSYYNSPVPASLEGLDIFDFNQHIFSFDLGYHRLCQLAPAVEQLDLFACTEPHHVYKMMGLGLGEPDLPFAYLLTVKSR